MQISALSELKSAADWTPDLEPKQGAAAAAIRQVANAYSGN